MTLSIRKAIVLCVCATALSSATAQAQIVAHFTDGAGTTSPDQYFGIAGDGWAAGWAASTGTTSGTVTSSSQLNSGGNYLTVANSGSGAGSATVSRRFTSFDGVSSASPYRITWDARFDGNMAHLDAFEDRLQFFGDTGAAGGTGNTNTWGIGWVAADQSGGLDIHEGNWYFYDNNGSTGFTAANMFNTGMGLAEDTVYSFVVEVDPTSGTYSASIFDGVTTVSADDLTFRRGAINVSGSNSFLNFGANRSSGTDDLTISFDSITITAVPEPSTWLMLGVASLGMLHVVRRRRV